MVDRCIQSFILQAQFPPRRGTRAGHTRVPRPKQATIELTKIYRESNRVQTGLAR